MRKHRLNFNHLLMVMTCLLLGYSGASRSAQLPSIHVEGRWLVDKHGNHVVLHGVMDTPNMYFNEYRWGSGWTDGTTYDANGAEKCKDYFSKLFEGLQKAKCDVFRLHLDPVWTNDNSITYVNLKDQPEHLIGDLPSGDANVEHFSSKRLSTFLNSLYVPLMLDAMNHGMYVVVRPPGICPNEIRVNGYYQKYLMEVWDSISKNETIRSYAGQISFELANEPVYVKNASGNYDKKALYNFFQPIVEKIRQNGFTGIIWIPGAGWQSNYVDYETYPINDNNFGYAVHDYEGWYGCEDKLWEPEDVPTATQEKITKFHQQVPVVDTNPVIVTEIDWSPIKSGSGHYNEHGEWVVSNYGTWATGRTSVWGTITKSVYDYYGNISMTLSGTACLIDINQLLEDGSVVPAFDGLEEACGKACMDWYAEYWNVNWAHPDTGNSDAEVNYLYIAEDTKLPKNKTGYLPISLNNVDEIVGLQFDIILPEGMSFEEKSFMINGDRTDSHTLSANAIDNFTIRIVCTSMENEVLSGVDGILLEMGIDVAEWVPNDVYPILLKDVKLTNSARQTVLCSDKVFYVTVGGKLGDVNHDDAVDVTDAVLIIDHILAKNPANFDASLADVNGDGDIDVTDVVFVIDAILGKIELSRGADLIDRSAYTAFQMDLTIPAGYVLESVSLTDIAKDSHSLAYTMLSDGRCRVVVCSMNNEALPGAWDEVIRLNLRGQGDAQVNIDRAVFVTIDGERHELMMNPTSIAELSTFNSHLSTRYDLQGRRVEKNAKGILIENGRKVVIK